MQNSLHTKLIVVASSIKVIVYKAKSIKIIKESEEFIVIAEKHNHHNKDKAESHFHTKSGPGSLFEPHSSPKDIEYLESAKKISEIIEQKINDDTNCKELIIVADPKLLGVIRQSLNNNIKKLVSKEIHKNLVDQDTLIIEKNIF